MTLFLAIVLGFLFGFVMQKVGAASPNVLINMLRLKDTHLMKAIPMGIGASCVALFIGLNLGIVDSGNLSVKAAYFGVLIGGCLLGLGWAISGFCPGTGVVGAGAGRADACSFLLGAFAGAFLYMLTYEKILDTVLFKDWGGKATLAQTGNEAFTALLPGLPSLLVGGVLGGGMILMACKIPLKKP